MIYSFAVGIIVVNIDTLLRVVITVNFSIGRTARAYNKWNLADAAR